jgi:hypothetical protein
MPSDGISEAFTVQDTLTEENELPGLLKAGQRDLACLSS